MRTISLYTTEGCHLCEQAETIADAVAYQFEANLNLVDISESDALVERYGLRIPVLRPQGTTLELGWPFDSNDVELLLQQAYR